MPLKDFPDKGELVVGTVIKAKGFGAFIKLEEYPDKEGFLHIKEVATGWVKNIRNYVREKQRVVCQVMDIDPSKSHIDLSLKRVNDHQKREKIQQWKNEQKAEKLLEMVAESSKIPLKKIHENVGEELKKKYGTLFRAFEEATTDPDILTEDGFKGEWIPAFITIAKENISVPFVNVKGFVKLFTPEKEGIKDITEALKKAEKNDKGIEVKVKYNSAPLYTITVQADEYKTAEKELKDAAEKAITYIQKLGGEGDFIREIK
jgi:translation initiation factor 2 subunit 1